MALWLLAVLGGAMLFLILLVEVQVAASAAAFGLTAFTIYRGGIAWGRWNNLGALGSGGAGFVPPEPAGHHR